MSRKRGGGKVSERKNNSSFWGFRLSSVFLFLLFITGLLGAFGSIIGKPVYSMFTVIMGSLAWAGPFLCLVLSYFLWTYSSDSMSSESARSGTSSHASGKRRQMQPYHQSPNQAQKLRTNLKHDVVPDRISLPAGKLVSLQGFNQYFSSPEWVEMNNIDTQRKEDMEDIGGDFPSYFGVGKSYYAKKPHKMTVLKGLKGYIEEVDREERSEPAMPWQVSVMPTETLGKLPEKPPEEPSLFSSVFKSQADQNEFLAQFKADGNSQKQEELDLTEILRERSRTIDEAEKIAQVIDQSFSKTQLESDMNSVLMPEIKSEFSLEIGLETGLECRQDSKLETDLEVKPETDSKEESAKEPTLVSNEKDELLETACTALPLLEFEAPVAVASALKPNYPEQVAQLVDQMMQEKQEIEEKQRAVSAVERVHWAFPDFTLLDPSPQHVIIQDIETPKLLEKVLLDFGVKAKVIRVARGPVITRYELAPAPGVKISKIVNLSDDIALGLAARDVRIEAPIPGKAAIGIEVPNKHARSVPFREVLETTGFGQYSSKLKVALGKDIADQPIIADLIKMPHLLVAGATGSGKSVCITTIINSILYNATPDEVKFLLVDPKMVELNQYNGIPHLLAPVVVDPKKAASALKWIVKEMENRYELFAAAGVRDIERYNKLKAGEKIRKTPALPFIVVIIDELADLMMVAAGEVEEAICRLAQMARAAGIHLVIATQRPSVDVITGVIKANIPSRISFAVSSQIDSRTILDATGAEKLLGRGDMLYSPLGVNKALRVQGCLVTDDEVQRVILHWKGLGRPEYLDPERLFAETTLKNEESNGPDDALFVDAGQLFIRTGIASVSFLQRRLKLGYARAARLMDMLEDQGVVGAYEGSKPRQVLLTLDEFNERFE